MIYHEVSQQSVEWFRIRLGLATSSCFDQIFTPVNGDVSKSAEGYADQIIAELLTGENEETFESYWMERGAEMESQASQSYEAITDFTLDRGGFMTNDEMKIGASPDRRIINPSTGKVVGGAEIKCPKGSGQIGNLLRGAINPKHKPQVQGQILICGFEFVDWFSFHPLIMPALVRTYRDDAYCDKLDKGLKEFTAMVDDKIDRLKAMGMKIPERPILAFHNQQPAEPQSILMAG